MNPEYETNCDVELERRCFHARGLYLRSLQSYTSSAKQLFLGAKGDAKKLSKISVNLNILRESCPKDIYPIEISDQVTTEMLAAQQHLLQKINREITNWINMEYPPLVDSYESFMRISKTVKWIVPSAFTGGPNERPLQFYVDSALDAMHYFKSIHELIRVRFKAISLFDSKSIDGFANVLKFPDQFEKLLTELLLLGRMIS